MKTTSLIGRRCKCSNVFSWAILIDRGLDLKWVVNIFTERSIIQFWVCTNESYAYGIFGGYYTEVTPVPIPNTEVKLCSAYDTWREAARESWSLPEQKERHCKSNVFLFVPTKFAMTGKWSLLKRVKLLRSEVLPYGRVANLTSLLPVKNFTVRETNNFTLNR